MPRESVTSLKQENQALKDQLDALFKEIKSLKDKCKTEGTTQVSCDNSSIKAANVESERSLQFLSDEYDDMTAANSDVLVQLKQITRRLQELSNQVERMGAEVSLQDIDIAHRVLTRRESDGPKPVICKFVRRLAKGKVMEVRKQAAEVNPTSIGLSADTEHRRVRLFDHLTPKKQKLLFEAKKLKERDHYRFCWAKKSVIYLKKDEGSRAIKITDVDCLRRLAGKT
ncbi:uncharacterized protein LOC122950793 [Acropora millepora]|uniref:uncharacterized protein LOC122950793 n=1 Tax=Acropora millepora TaxID=45264 RepID=UPI001CF52682|nr:uncharacterized protein LOC122950793 [Acropora millepora]